MGQQLTDLQKSWIEFYLVSLNATDAARRAGYACENPNTYRTIGHTNLVKFREVINARLREVLPSPEDVLARIAAIDYSQAQYVPFAPSGSALGAHRVISPSLLHKEPHHQHWKHKEGHDPVHPFPVQS